MRLPILYNRFPIITILLSAGALAIAGCAAPLPEAPRELPPRQSIPQSRPQAVPEPPPQVVTAPPPTAVTEPAPQVIPQPPADVALPGIPESVPELAPPPLPESISEPPSEVTLERIPSPVSDPIPPPLPDSVPPPLPDSVPTPTPEPVAEKFPDLFPELEALDNANSQPVAAVDNTPAPVRNIQPGELEYDVLHKANFNPFNINTGKSFRALQTLRIYQSELGRHSLETAKPVDFDTAQVLVSSAGEKPTGGYTISVTGMELTADEVIVTVVQTIPGPSCVTTAGKSHPFEFVLIPSKKPIQIFERQKVENC